MSGLGDRLDVLATAAMGAVNPPPPRDVAARGRRRRARRRILTATASVAAIAAVVAVTIGGGADSTTRVTTISPPVTILTGAPPLRAIAAVSTVAVSAVAGPPAALGEVVGSTASAAAALLDASAAPLQGIGKGNAPHVAPNTTSRTKPVVAVWWVLITRHHSCSLGCAEAAIPATDYVSVFLRASDLHVVQVRSLGSEQPNLALAGPVFPLVLTAQVLPDRQPAIPDVVVPASTIETDALRDQNCAIPGRVSGLRDALPAGPGASRCTSVTVRLYPNWSALGNSVPGVVEPGLAFSQPSRPVYYVTIWGQLSFRYFKGLGKAPSYVDRNNGIYDAITGQGEGGGTAGEPLP